MRVGLDTNVLAYLSGVDRAKEDEAKIVRVKALVRKLPDITFVAPVQALGELFVVLRKSGMPAVKAREVLTRIADGFAAPASELRTVSAALDLVVDHKLQFWDAMIVSAAADAGCALLLSEDMQHGFVSRGLTIVNPLAEEAHPKLAALLSGT